MDLKSVLIVSLVLISKTMEMPLCGQNFQSQFFGGLSYPSCNCPYAHPHPFPYPVYTRYVNKENPLPVVLANNSLSVHLKENPERFDYTCPVDSPFRPCYRLEGPKHCITDDDCKIDTKIPLLCCFDACLNHEVCKPPAIKKI